MPDDATTFFAAFAALFGGILLYLWRLEVAGRRLEERLRLVETRDRRPSDGDMGGRPRDDEAPPHAEETRDLR